MTTDSMSKMELHHRETINHLITTDHRRAENPVTTVMNYGLLIDELNLEDGICAEWASNIEGDWTAPRSGGTF